MSAAILRLSLSFGITVSNARTGAQAAATSAPQINMARPASVSFVIIIPSLTCSNGYATCCHVVASRVAVPVVFISQEPAMIIRSASAQYSGLGKDGKGHVSTQSGVLDKQPYGFNTRFEDGKGTNPEELIAAAHASCFTMALSFALAGAGYQEGELDTTAKVSLDKEGDGF